MSSCNCGAIDGIHSTVCPVGIAIIAGRSQGSAENGRDSGKMQPGEVDKIFQACCPQCDGHVWVFIQAVGTLASQGIVDPDCRVCRNCRYVHWLRGPNTSKVVPLPHPESAPTSKKDRVRALVLAILSSPKLWGQTPAQDIVTMALELDALIEATK